ncbi:MAG TPA: glycosyl hydrolase family 18 protein [Candidatus Angelobacter sp.]|nr:glycosyl hydrolase family 18 protein [Candidatus Angelobacter sp.]
MSIHVVQSGESLWSLSHYYSQSVDVIKTVNGLPADLIMPGLALYLPDPEPIRFYRIKARDTLWKLALQFRTSVGRLLEANPNLSPEKLSIGQVVAVPTPIKYPLQTLAFVDAYLPQSVSNQLSSLSPLLTYVAVFGYATQSNGALTPARDDALLQLIKAQGIRPLLVVSNSTGSSFSPDLARLVLDPLVRANLIRSIKQNVLDKGYAGVSTDFEFIPANLRPQWTAFLLELKQALGGLILQVNVPSKTSDMPTNPIVGAYDYAAIGKIADIFTVLTYDYGYSIGPPDPIAPPWWIEQVITYTLTLVPKSKVMMAIPLYAYDWLIPDLPTVNAAALSVNAAQNLALSHYSLIQYDSHNESPYFSYMKDTHTHKVWFEDPRSLLAKYRLLEAYELPGVAYWRLGFDFPQNWAFIKDNFQVVK